MVGIANAEVSARTAPIQRHSEVFHICLPLTLRRSPPTDSVGVLLKRHFDFSKKISGIFIDIQLVVKY